MFHKYMVTAAIIRDAFKRSSMQGILNITPFLTKRSNMFAREISNWNAFKPIHYHITVRSLCQAGDAINQNNETEKNEIEERDPSKDRSKVIPPETSIRYLKSKAYEETYEGKPVWFYYRRNFKGGIAPRTRKTCIRKQMISTGSPCPICRDEYLVLDHTNIELLKQFICPHTGEVYPTKKTGLCQRQHKNLLLAIEKAKDYGFITFQVPFRNYNYEEFYPLLSRH